MVGVEIFDFAGDFEGVVVGVVGVCVELCS